MDIHRYKANACPIQPRRVGYAYLCAAVLSIVAARIATRSFVPAAVQSSRMLQNSVTSKGRAHSWTEQRVEKQMKEHRAGTGCL